MTLTRSSVLHYWSSRYGINPRIGGRPVHTRNSAGYFQSQEGEVTSAIVNTPRFDWASLNYPGAQTERRRLLTLELARSNNISIVDFSNGAWVKTTCTVTPNITAPDGSSGAFTLTATGANAAVTQALSAGSSLVRVGGVWIKRRTGTGVINILSPDTGVYNAAAVTPTWQRFQSAAIGASVNRWGQIQIVTNGDAVDAWLYDIQDGTFTTSSVLGTRATDIFYWNYPPAPQAQMWYMRFVERGTLGSAGARILAVTSLAGANPELAIIAGGGSYSAYQNSVTSTVASAATIGDTVELVLALQANGAVLIIQSVNGAAVTAGSTSSPQSLSVWSDTKLWLNSEGIVSFGSSQYAEVKIVKFADVVALTNQGIMDELRTFELGPNGDVL